MKRAVVLTPLLALASGFLLVHASTPGSRGQQESPLAAVLLQIKTAEYEITWANATPLQGLAASWQAPNRAQGFRTFFTPSGIRVLPRRPDGAPWEWALTLQRAGRGAVEAVAEARLSVHDNRVEYDRGTLSEWYVNDARGLEQGFTLNELPGTTASLSDKHATSSVLLDLALTGSLTPRYSVDGQAIDFLAPDGRPVIHYGSLVVKDADDRSLPAHLEPFSYSGESGVRIVLDDRDARYPITVDPLATTAAWQDTGHSSYYAPWLGYSVGTAGDVNKDGYSDIIYGAPHQTTAADGKYDGAFYVGLGSPSANFSDHSSYAGDGPEEQIGYAVSTGGDVDGDGYDDIVVGVPRKDSVTSYALEVGEVWLYYGGANGIDGTRSPVKLQFQNTNGGQHFGASVSPAGDINGDGYADFVASAPDVSNGAVVTYLGSASGPSQSTVIQGSPSCHLGHIVAGGGDANGDGYGDILIVDHPSTPCAHPTAKAYLHTGAPGGLNTVAAWQSDGSGSGYSIDGYGEALAFAGDINGDGYADWIVGAPLSDNPQPPNYWMNTGAALAYHGSASVSSTTPAVVLWGTGRDDSFGAAVATAGDVNADGYADLLVGAPEWNQDSEFYGAAYAFAGSSSGVQTSPFWSVQSSGDGDKFGAAVATAGDVNGDGYSDVIIGAYGYSGSTGKALVYLGSRDGMKSTAAWNAGLAQDDAHAGYSVAMGDANGDGFADLAVGVPDYDVGLGGEGAVWVWHGAAAGPAASPSWSAFGTQVGEGFGTSLAFAGDVNNDGYADLVVGAPHHTVSGQVDNGFAPLYLGGPTGLAATPWWWIPGTAGSQYGSAVATNCDVNGDGYADLVVGQPGSGAGTVQGYAGSASGFGTAPTWTLTGVQDGSRFGAAVACAGDLDGDGISDIAVGSPFYTGRVLPDPNPQFHSGRVDVWFGSLSGLTALSNWHYARAGRNTQLGAAVASAGDLDGDGYSDLVVGQPYYSIDQPEQGYVVVFHGSSAGLPSVPDDEKTIVESYAHFGAAVGSAGDLDGDGKSELLVGVPGYYDTQSRKGGVYVYPSSGGSPMILKSDQTDSSFGAAVAGSADVNGDGVPDLLVGAYHYDGPNVESGHAFLHYGGLLRPNARPQQRRTDDTLPVVLLGASNLADGFRVALTIKNPLGRGKVKLEKEVKPLGAPFDGSGSSSTSWLDTGLGGVRISDTFPRRLFQGTAYHWRIRPVYSSDSPFVKHGPWIPGPAFTNGETSIRTRCIGSTPTGSPHVTVTRESGSADVAWTTIANAARYDAVRGWLSYLRSTSGDFTQATTQCLANNTSETRILDSDTPDAEDGFWYLVRGSSCAANGTYDDDSGGGQTGSRDAEINASSQRCP